MHVRIDIHTRTRAQCANAHTTNPFILTQSIRDKYADTYAHTYKNYIHLQNPTFNNDFIHPTYRNTHTNAQVYTHTKPKKCLCAFTCVYRHTQAHVLYTFYIYMYIYKYVYSYTNMHTYMYAHLYISEYIYANI